MSALPYNNYDGIAYKSQEVTLLVYMSRNQYRFCSYWPHPLRLKLLRRDSHPLQKPFFNTVPYPRTAREVTITT